MALQWVRTAIRSDSALGSDFWTVVQVPIGATLKRTIVSWWIYSDAQNAGDLFSWTTTPIINTIEVTSGSPPPFPEDPGITLPDNRDFLHYDVTTMSSVLVGGTTTKLTTAAFDTSVGKIDTKVQRKAETDPLAVYWSWGLLLPVLSRPSEGAFSRMVASSLLDVPSGTNVVSRMVGNTATVEDDNPATEEA